MAGAQPGAIVAVEIFVEQDQVTPQGVVLELLRGAVHGPAAVGITQEKARQTAGNFGSHFPKGQHVT